MDAPSPKLEAMFFKTLRGNEPVREWLRSLHRVDRKSIGDDVLKVQYCWPVGMPLVRSLGGGLWEVRSGLSDGIGRIIFIVSDGKMVLLHGFVKKAQRTPKHELDVAIERRRQLS